MTENLHRHVYDLHFYCRTNSIGFTWNCYLQYLKNNSNFRRLELNSFPSCSAPDRAERLSATGNAISRSSLLTVTTPVPTSSTLTMQTLLSTVGCSRSSCLLVASAQAALIILSTSAEACFSFVFSNLPKMKYVLNVSLACVTWGHSPPDRALRLISSTVFFLESWAERKTNTGLM